jgi:hypothetical protein
MLIYNIEFGTWTVWKDINARCVTIGYLNNKKQLLIGRENGTIAYLNREARTDFGDSYNSRFKTGVLYPGGDMTVERRYLSLTVLVSSTANASIGVSWNIDGRSDNTSTFTIGSDNDLLGTTFVLGTSVLGIGQFLPVTVTLDGHGTGIQLEFSVQSDGDVEFYGFILEVEDENPTYGVRTT